MTTHGSVISQPVDSKDGRASVDPPPPGSQSLKPGHVYSSAAAVRRALLTLGVERNEWKGTLHLCLNNGVSSTAINTDVLWRMLGQDAV